MGTTEFQFPMNGIIFVQPKRLKYPYSWVEHIPFAFFLVNILKPKIFVELGVHTGNSYNAFCQAVEVLNMNTQCYGIDTWRGDEHTKFYDESIYNELLAYQLQEYQEFSFLLKGTFDEMRESFEDKCIDLLHIDGFHTYEAVKHDFESWLPKMSEKGVVILHDTVVKERDFGVWKLWEEISTRYPSFNFTHGYGLGMVAVGKQVAAEFLNFLESARIKPFYQELFHKLGHSVVVPLEHEAENHRLTNIIEQKDQHIRNLEAMLRQNDLPTAYVAQLFVDTGTGFSEEQSIVQTVTGNEQQLEFDLSQYFGIQHLRFDPLNDLTCVEIRQILVLDDQGTVHQITNYQANTIYAKEGCPVFDTIDPQILIHLQFIEQPVKITFHLKYLTMGEKTYRLLWELEREKNGLK